MAEYRKIKFALGTKAGMLVYTDNLIPLDEVDAVETTEETCNDMPSVLLERRYLKEKWGIFLGEVSVSTGRPEIVIDDGSYVLIWNK